MKLEEMGKKCDKTWKTENENRKLDENILSCIGCKEIYYSYMKRYDNKTNIKPRLTGKSL